MRLLYIFETKVIQIVIYLNPITPYLSTLYSFTHNFMFIHTYQYVRTFENILRESHNLPVLVLKNKKVSFFFNRNNFLPYCTIPHTKKFQESNQVGIFYIATYIYKYQCSIRMDQNVHQTSYIIISGKCIVPLLI